MNIGQFVLENEEKIDRAINGTPGRGGVPQGGVGKDAKPEVLLAEYDRLGGLVTKGGRKIKTGSFFSFKDKKPRTEPEVVYELRDLDGNKVELKEGEDVPVEVIAAEKRNKGKSKSKISADDETLSDEEETPKTKKKSKKAAEDEE